MRRFLFAIALVAILCTMFFVGAVPSHAQQQAIHVQQHSAQCAMKLIKYQGGHARTYICFDKQGKAISTGAVPSLIESCLVVVYADGPFHPDTGDSLCFQASGNNNVPIDFNDQASSWIACTGGVFFTNSNEGGGSGSYS